MSQTTEAKPSQGPCSSPCYKMPIRWKYERSSKYKNPQTGLPLWVVLCKRCGKFVGYAYAKPEENK